MKLDTHTHTQSPLLPPPVVKRCSARGALCIAASLALSTFIFLTCSHDDIYLTLGDHLPSPTDPSRPDTLLYAASYGGSIFTLNLTAAYDLYAVHTSDGCKPSPSWLTLDSLNSVLYCTDEGLSSDHGSVSAFDVSEDGSLSLRDRVNVIPGPVSAITYGQGGRSLAVAQ